MPTLDDLNEIKSDLLSLGDEPGILAAKGETPVDIGPPETGLSDDLNALFDDFADVEETDSASDSLPPEPVEGFGGGEQETEGIEDFDFDPDGFDEPEDGGTGIGKTEPTVPDSLVHELVEGDMDGFEAPKDVGIDGEGMESPEDPGAELLDGLYDELEEETGSGFGEEDLSFEDLVSEDTFTDSQAPEPGDGDTDDLSMEEELDFDETEDFSFEETSSEFPDSDLSAPELAEGVEANDFDLGEDFDFDDTSDTDNLEMMGDELDLGGGEELSLDDSDADSVDPGDYEIDDTSLDDDLDIDEFDLGDLGQDFGVLEDDFSSALSQEISIEESSSVENELEEEEFELSEEAFGRLKASLQDLPRNLKLIIEEEIGEKGLKGPSLKKLIDALVEGKGPKEIAAITSRIVGRKIKIPANYSKKTGLDFEEEKGSFQYTLVHNIIPLIKIFLISSIILAAVGFVSYKFIYKPIYANILYNRGWDQLEESNYNGSADLFDKAFNEFKIKKQFYRYAEGYIDADQWAFARAQYENLLKNYPFDKKGTIDYANMEFEKLADYEHSTEILNTFLAEDKNKRDYDVLLLLGDIYLEWGWENSDMYEEARLAYAKIMSTYGVSNKILFRMLKYFIRTDNPKEVTTLKKRFQADSELEVDPAAYAELAAYQIDHQDISDVETLLFRAKDVDDSLPEIHYQLARLFRITGEGEEEDKALIKTFAKLDNIHSLNRRNRQIKIDAYRRQGERFYRKEEYLQAEEDYQKGIELLKESRERNIIKGKNSNYGKLYADLGHIYYYISQDPDKALDIYETAESEEFHSPEIYYNKGNIRYRNGDFRQALLDFYNSAGSFSVNSNLLYATGNTLFMRNDYFAAQGYYNHLLDILEQKISSQSSIRINEREDQRRLVESIMKAYNNMGVTLYGLFQRTGDPSKFTAAMLNFTKSNEYFDDLTRDPATLQRTEMINLASLNQRKMLYPIPDYELQIFANIPKRLNPK